MNDIAHLTLEHLKALRAGQERMEAQLGDLTGRVSGMEHQLAGIHLELAGIHGDIAGVQVRQDRHDERLLRIEKRLELLPA